MCQHIITMTELHHCYNTIAVFFFYIPFIQLYTETKKHLASCSRDDAFQVYQLYHILQKINYLANTFARKYAKQITRIEAQLIHLFIHAFSYEQLAISKTHQLFDDFVPAWISIALARAEKDIQRVVAIDTVCHLPTSYRRHNNQMRIIIPSFLFSLYPNAYESSWR